jgi:hypothetical protein
MNDEHSKEFNEIMKRAPNRLTRYGFVILLVLLAVLLVFSIQYWKEIFS